MQTNVTQTSLYSYSEFVKDKSEVTQSEKVLASYEKGNNTINKIARDTGMECGKVSARLNLLKDKEILTKTGLKEPDPITGVPNETWMKVVNNKMEVVK